ncbi:ROK family protein [Luteococcus sp. OSA5]|uniref:ROK family protein n=1 Tax=Luteococcus sp. OSA5 TaxID=3401630 RepID=UPI003B42AAD2
MVTTPGALKQSSLRSFNLSLVLGHVLAQKEPCSRADVAVATGMTRSTVSRLVDELVEHGLLAELAPLTGQRGRPAVPLVAAQGTMVALGLEANVSRLVARAVDLSGRVVAERLVPGQFANSDADQVVGQLARLANECLADLPTGSRHVGTQLAVAGLVDGERGLVLRAPNLGWSQVDVPQAFTHHGFNAADPPRVANEADCAALTVAQSAPGKSSDLDQFLYISGEVGIGCAAVFGGEVMTGRHGWAGELGHVCVDPDGRACACGARGCLESYAGLGNLLEIAGLADMDALLQALGTRERRAADAVQVAGRALGVATSSALNLLDVSVVALGGHLAPLSQWLTPVLSDELSQRVLSAPFEPPTVTTMSLDAGTAATGAAYAVLNRLIANPLMVL